MKTKSLITIFMALGFVTFLSGCGKTQDVTTDVQTTTDDVISTDVVQDTQVQDDTTTKKASKDQCLELTVLAMKVALSMTNSEASAEDWIAKAASLEEKYRKQNIEFELECEKYMVELDYMQEVQKRLENLK